MQGFRFSKFEEGEEIIFGPHAESSQTKLSVRRASEVEHPTHTSVRIVCVTNKRVIIETGDSAVNIPTHDIQTVVIKRNPGKKGASLFDLLYIKSKTGHRVELDIPNLEASRESDLPVAFPHAEIKARNKGLLGLLDKILGD